MKKIYDLACKTGTYKTSNGENKNRYENVGSIFESDNGQFIILKKSFNPAGISQGDGKDSIIISMFKADEGKKSADKTKDNFENPFDESSVPF